MEKHFHKFWLRADMFSERTRVSGTNNSNKEPKFFCVYAKKNANNAFHNALFAHRTYIEMKKLSYIAEIHT